MGQVCNISYTTQLDSKLDEDERKKFVAELYAPPGRPARASFVTPQLDALMAPPSMRRGGRR